MNNIAFNQDGGFRLSTNILNAVQASYSLFNALGWIGGNMTIISGCEVTGSTVSDGVVFIDGEVFNFKGGNIGTNVIIQQTVTNYPFQNGTVKPVIYERFATFGTSVTNYPWADFKRLFATKDIQAFKDNHEQRILALENRQSDVPSGVVMRYNQPLIVLPPAGWEDFNPENEQGRVWVARSTTDADFGLGSTGGTKTHQLSIAEMPNHSHDLFFERYPRNIGNQNPGFDGGSNNYQVNVNKTTSSVGSNLPHNNLQPYVGVRFIIKL